MSGHKRPSSLTVANTAMCAALYAVGAYAASFIISRGLDR